MIVAANANRNQGSPLLSVIVPAYNEERTLDELLRQVVGGPYAYPEKEVIVVDDGSTDRTPDVLRYWAGQPGVRIVRHERNRGKGAAVRTGLAEARGELTLIQDADLEYDPADYPQLIETLRKGKATVVYGSRYLQPDRGLPWSSFRLGVCFLNGLVRWLYGQRLTDEATCYKALRTQLLRDLNLQAERFELCPEITAKVSRLGYQIVEVPISYRPRSTIEGKKIRLRDGWSALLTLLRWRFSAFQPGH